MRPRARLEERVRVAVIRPGSGGVGTVTCTRARGCAGAALGASSRLGERGPGAARSPRGCEAAGVRSEGRPGGLLRDRPGRVGNLGPPSGSRWPRLPGSPGPAASGGGGWALPAPRGARGHPACGGGCGREEPGDPPVR